MQSRIFNLKISAIETLCAAADWAYIQKCYQEDDGYYEMSIFDIFDDFGSRTVFCDFFADYSLILYHK